MGKSIMKMTDKTKSAIKDGKKIYLVSETDDQLNTIDKQILVYEYMVKFSFK